MFSVLYVFFCYLFYFSLCLLCVWYLSIVLHFMRHRLNCRKLTASNDQVFLGNLVVIFVASYVLILMTLIKIFLFWQLLLLICLSSHGRNSWRQSHAHVWQVNYLTFCKNHKPFKRYSGFAQNMVTITQIHRGSCTLSYVEFSEVLHMTVLIV